MASAALLVGACAHGSAKEGSSSEAPAQAQAGGQASGQESAQAGDQASGQPADRATAGDTAGGQQAMSEPDRAGAAQPAQGGTGSSGAAAGSGVVQGRIEQIDRANNVFIAGSERAGMAFDRFKADDRTEVTIGGKRASIEDVNPGDEVRASFSGSGDTLHLDQLQVTASRSGAPATPPAATGEEPSKK